MAGRLVEVSGAGEGIGLTLAFGLAWDAQRRIEPVAWVTTADNSFFPPDAAQTGVDLQSLVVVRLCDPRSVGRAADRLVRSGAFGLVVLDLGRADLPVPLQARLAGLAHRHLSAVVCLTEKSGEAPSLGPLISLRVQGRRQIVAPGRFRCEARVVKDKRRGPTWEHVEDYVGPDGLY
ncbi:MAG: recombinase A [Armatimonadota bacterium]|nr:recombinase A [Armatimonadota bacterium]MDR5696418.1 recombinase A [Armatimonadota bacterium]